MKHQIVLTIECEDERCGGCEGTTNTTLFDCPWVDRKASGWMRGPDCLRAEARFRALVEAGKRMTNTCCEGTKAALAWDRAVKDVENG